MAEPKPSQAKITIAYQDISTNIVHIDDAKPIMKKYNCLGCNEFLIACNQGLKRNHYFRHEKNSECDGISKEEKERKRQEEEERLLDEERIASACKKKEEEERRKREEEARIRQEKYEKAMEEKRIKIQEEMKAKRLIELKIKKINNKKKREKIKEIEKAKDIDKGTIYKYLENPTWFINHPIEEFNQSFKSIELLHNFVVKNDLMNTLDKDARIHLKNK